MDDKRRVVGVTWFILNFAAPTGISGMAEARIVKIYTDVEYIKS